MNLPQLAKLAIETYLKEGKIIEPPQDLPKEFLEEKAGTFVTIEKNQELRGCIGTYLPTRPNIAQEVIRNAIAAASKDYRFGPVQINELPYLSYIVYVLNLPEPVKGVKELDPKKYGIIVKTSPFIYPGQNNNNILEGSFFSSKSKTGLLLPDLKGVDTIEDQIFIACQKAGIDPQKEKFFIYKFTAKKYQ